MGSLTRLLDFSANCLLSNLGGGRLPYRVMFVLTNRCNGRCLTCNIWKKEATGELSTDECLKVVSSLSGVNWLDLMGGEIFMRPDLDAILEAVDKDCRSLYLFHFATNGLLTQRIAAFCEKILSSRIPRTIVTVSIDAPGEANDAIRGVKGSWERSVATLSALRRLSGPKFKAVVGMTISEHNYGLVDELFARLSQEVGGLRKDDFHLNLGQKSFYYDNNSAEGLDAREYRDVVGDYHKAQRPTPFSPYSFLEGKYRSLLGAFVDGGKCPLPCKSGAVSCMIGPSGDVYPCITYGRSMGNLRAHCYSLPAIWESEGRKTIAAEIAKGKCPHCWTPCEAYQTIISNFPRALVR